MPSSDFTGPNLTKHAHIELAARLDGELEDSNYDSILQLNSMILTQYAIDLFIRRLLHKVHLCKELSPFRNKAKQQSNNKP